jgi:hypothetical protein
MRSPIIIPRLAGYGLAETLCAQPCVGSVKGSGEVRGIEFIKIDGLVKTEGGSFHGFDAI